MMPTLPQSSFVEQDHNLWSLDNSLPDQSTQFYSHDIEALSAAALYTPSGGGMIPQPTSMSKPSFSGFFDLMFPHINQGSPAVPSPDTVSSSNDLNLLLNSLDTFDSSPDSSLTSSSSISIPLPSSRLATVNAQKQWTAGEAESEHNVAHLLRHFSELPGKW